VNKTAVGEAAKSYARQLILSCETLMSRQSQNRRRMRRKPRQAKGMSDDTNLFIFYQTDDLEAAKNAASIKNTSIHTGG
jgi:hypothetical protein